MNNVKNSIGWADFTWNPVTGCKRGCPYCYARKNWNRFHRNREGIEFSEIKFYPERLTDRRLFDKMPLKIFCDSMSDFEYWSENAITALMHICKTFKHHTFMILSKSTRAYHTRGFKIDYPFNVMLGLTVENPSDIMSSTQIDNMCWVLRPFLSIEPIMGPMKYDLPEKYEVVIVAQSRLLVGSCSFNNSSNVVRKYGNRFIRINQNTVLSRYKNKNKKTV